MRRFLLFLMVSSLIFIFEVLMHPEFFALAAVFIVALVVIVIFHRKKRVKADS